MSFSAGDIWYMGTRVSSRTGAEWVVAADDHEFSGGELELLLGFVEGRRHEGAADFAVVERDKDKARAGGVFQSEGLEQERGVLFGGGFLRAA